MRPILAPPPAPQTRPGEWQRHLPTAALAWAVPGLTAALGALAVGAAARRGSAVVDDRNTAPLPLLLVILAACLLFAGVGALVAARRPRNPVGWCLAVLGLGLMAVFAVKAWADLTLVVEPGSLPDPTVAILLTNCLTPLALLAPTVLLLHFPDGCLPSLRWRPVRWAAIAAAVAWSAGLALRPGEIEPSDFPGVRNPLGASGPAADVAEILVVAGAVVATAALVLALASQIVRYRAAGLRERQQIKWIAYPVAVNLVGSTAAEFVPDPWSTVLWGLGFAGLVALPVAAAAAVLRHRLYDIDLIISRTLVYGALTGCVVTVYIAVVAWLGALLQVEDDLAISLVATGVVAVSFAPLRERVQRAVHRLVLGRRDDPYAVLTDLGRRLEAAVAPAAALTAVVEAVGPALALRYTALRVRSPGGEEAVAAEWGVLAGEQLSVPLVHQREPVGTLVLAPRAAVREADGPLVDDLARQAAAAVHAARLTAELQHARERLVAGREEERRRLRRDLHDGLGPQLAAQTLKVGSARALYGVRPQEADALLVEIEADVARTLADLRRVIEDLRPPALDELGLAGALHEAAGRYRLSGPIVEVTASDLPPLPAAVEVAAFRIADEAVTNVVRHARARSCIVRVWRSDGGLVVEVTDDGVGISGESTGGVGLASMRERAAELGGSCEVTPVDGGGTRVRAVLPVREEASGERA
jgi:signal transduction histidine kinase